ncbi:hypothetical protein OE749_17450 [Aestuariibacter sp. AA17]|uniref:Uncharacterized protein n=1 Tax=Fluctibacter corallii TaxID=2984329 RepID=A0ABT3ACT9_9ALTE|nr:hypothetical protein [Aestuariibacter sp. AA17]MCV2886485.1 hypothetical protein [Aestuariibacter sp. AA17]
MSGIADVVGFALYAAAVWTVILGAAGVGDEAVFGDQWNSQTLLPK